MYNLQVTMPSTCLPNPPFNTQRSTCGFVQELFGDLFQEKLEKFNGWIQERFSELVEEGFSGLVQEGFSGLVQEELSGLE